MVYKKLHRNPLSKNKKKMFKEDETINHEEEMANFLNDYEEDNHT